MKREPWVWLPGRRVQKGESWVLRHYCPKDLGSRIFDGYGHVEQLGGCPFCSGYPAERWPKVEEPA